MLIDRSHRWWLLFCVIVLVIAGAGYWFYSTRAINGPSGASLPGLIYGALGTLCMFFAGALGLRRRLRSWRLGTGKFWMAAHLWLGALALPLIWFHGGFHHGGPLTSVMMFLFYAVVASGLVGIIIQQVLPSRIRLEVPNETLFERIPVAIELLAKEAEGLVGRYENIAESAMTAAWAGGVDTDAISQSLARSMTAELDDGFGQKPVVTLSDDQTGPLADFYRAHVRSYLSEDSPAARETALAAAFTQARSQLPPTAQVPLARLEEICLERRQLDVQQRLHVVLHSWLFVHVPLSMALIVLTVVHIVMALRWAM